MFVRAESKFWCLLARKHSRLLITVRFCVCVPFCWPAHVRMLPCIHVKQQPKLELPQGSKKESVSLACVCLVTRKHRAFLSGWCREATARAGQDCRARRTELGRSYQPVGGHDGRSAWLVPGDLHHGKGPCAKMQLPTAAHALPNLNLSVSWLVIEQVILQAFKSECRAHSKKLSALGPCAEGTAWAEVKVAPKLTVLVINYQVR